MSCECAGVCLYATIGVSEGQIHLKQVSEPLNECVNQDKNAGLVQDPPFWRIPDIKTNGKGEKQKEEKERGETVRNGNEENVTLRSTSQNRLVFWRCIYSSQNILKCT